MTEPESPVEVTKPPNWARRHKVWTATGVIVIALFVGDLMGHAGARSQAAATSTPAPAPTATETITVPEPGVTATVTSQVSVPGPTTTATVTAQPPPPAHKIPGDGTFLVGKDVVPGTYKAAANSGCYWSLNSAGNGLSSVIANDNTDGQAIIQVPASAYSVTTQSCATFYLIS